MADAQGYTFVLWGDQFAEVAATVFVAEFRAAGLRVKLVSLARKKLQGVYGLALVPDLTLEQARRLAAQASVIIVPCAGQSLRRLENDPRLLEFVQQACQHGARLVVGPCTNDDLAPLRLFEGTQPVLVPYGSHEDWSQVARRVAAQVVGSAAAGRDNGAEG